MEAKLAEYRAKKSAEKKVVERNNKIWNFFTLKFLRRSNDSSNNDLQGVIFSKWTVLDTSCR